MRNLYDEGKALEDAGKRVEAAQRWRTAAGQELVAPLLASWFLFRGAESLAARQQWKESDKAYPEAIERFPLNSALALTIPPKIKEGQENGLLQAWEIFEQMRLDADLVTLSACNTGLGQELNGEGLIGLTRAFHFAGARSILASLWSVDDYRTMQLMKRFYAELHAGASKDAALRTAQLQLLHSSSQDPYYWAAFSLMGDWR